MTPVPDTPCELWQGPIGSHGYGNDGRHLAHRRAYERTYGPIPAGLVVMHLCDNPPCVRPDHLQAGTQAENLAMARERGRMDVHAHHLRGERVHGARLTEAAVREIRGSALSNRSLAAWFGVSKGTIMFARQRKTWRHVTDELEAS